MVEEVVVSVVVAVSVVVWEDKNESVQFTPCVTIVLSADLLVQSVALPHLAQRILLFPSLDKK